MAFSMSLLLLLPHPVPILHTAAGENFRSINQISSLFPLTPSNGFSTHSEKIREGSACTIGPFLDLWPPFMFHSLPSPYLALATLVAVRSPGHHGLTTLSVFGEVPSLDPRVAAPSHH